MFEGKEPIHEFSGPHDFAPPVIVAVSEKEIVILRELIETMAKTLIEYPDQVSVSEIAGEHAFVIELRTAKGDLGKIVGKKGRNAQAMRTISSAASAKLRKRLFLRLLISPCSTSPWNMIYV